MKFDENTVLFRQRRILTGLLVTKIFSHKITSHKTFTAWFKNCSDGQLYIFYHVQIYSFFSSLNPAIHIMGNASNVLCPRCKEQIESQPYFIFYCKFSKITLDFTSELNNLKYVFNIPFKITLKTIIMVTSSQFHDRVHLTQR